MLDSGSEQAEKSVLAAIRPEDRIAVVSDILDHMKKSSLSRIQEYVMQKAIGLFLLGEHINRDRLYARVVLDGLAELTGINILINKQDNEIMQAINALEHKKILAYSEGVEMTMRIENIRTAQLVLVRNVNTPERSPFHKGW